MLTYTSLRARQTLRSQETSCLELFNCGHSHLTEWVWFPSWRTYQDEIKIHVILVIFFSFFCRSMSGFKYIWFKHTRPNKFMHRKGMGLLTPKLQPCYVPILQLDFARIFNNSGGSRGVINAYIYWNWNENPIKQFWRKKWLSMSKLRKKMAWWGGRHNVPEKLANSSKCYEHFLYRDVLKKSERYQQALTVRNFK